MHWSALYASPVFNITVPTDVSSVEILNRGHAAAHNILITVRAEGDERSAISEFSSENYTLSSPTYDYFEYNLGCFSAQMNGPASFSDVNFEKVLGESQLRYGSTPTRRATTTWASWGSCYLSILEFCRIDFHPFRLDRGVYCMAKAKGRKAV